MQQVRELNLFFLMAVQHFTEYNEAFKGRLFFGVPKLHPSPWSITPSL
jgi:hypothetical protein